MAGQRPLANAQSGRDLLPLAEWSAGAWGGVATLHRAADRGPHALRLQPLMKIAVITIRNLYGAYFVSRIREAFPGDVCLVIAQQGAPRPAAPGEARAPRTRPPAPAALLRKLYWKAYELREMKMAPSAAEAVWGGGNVRATTDINAPENILALEEAGPDLILVFGGKILSDRVLATARHAVLNLHAGRLPEYRGSNTLKWMLWNLELDDVCATVHIAERGVDAGAVVDEARITLRRSDTFRTIFARLHVAGVAAMVRAATAARDGNLPRRAQVGVPRTFLAREWTSGHEAALDGKLARALRERFAPTLEKRVVRQLYRRIGPLVAPIRPPRPSSAAVLLYHNVEPVESPFVRELSITMTPEDFEAHIRFLTSHYEVVPFSEIVTRRDHAGVVAVSLDDGLRCIETTVLPIAEKYRCPIRIFALGERPADGCNWLNKLSWLLSTLPAEARSDLERAALTPMAVRREGVQAFIEGFAEGRTIPVIEAAYARAAPEPPAPMYLTDAQLRALAGHPLVEVGTHTRNHYPLHRLSPATLRDQVVENHREMVARLGPRISGFATPFGFPHHFTADVVQAIATVDRAVVTAYGGWVDRRELFGVPEIKRVGAWGGVGTLAHELAHHLT